jgi:PAS domain S-box-containing protein
LFDEAPVGYHELDIQGRIVEVNRTEQEMLGYRAEEMLGHQVWLFIVDGEASRTDFEGLLATPPQSGTTVEHTVRRKDGTTLSVLNTTRVIRNEGGKVVGIRAALQDITERKRAEQALLTSEERLKLALSATLTGVWEWNIRTNEVFWSQECYDIVGMDSSTEKTLEGFQKVVHPDDLDRFNGTVQHSLSHKTQFAIEFRTITPRGEVLWLHNMGRAEYDVGGNPIRMIGTVQDITQRKKEEEHITESEEQFRLIAENVADMIAVLDLDGRRIYNSPSYRNILGDPESLKGTEGYQEIHPDDRERVRQVFEETVKTGVGKRMEYRLMGKDGYERTIDSKGSVIRDGEGKIIRVVVVSRDVTEEKMLAAQFLRSQRMESIGALAGGIAHDLNNVLAPIMMAIEILKKKVSDEGGQRILSTIETSARRGADIVRQVLAFGRGVKGDRMLVQLEHVVIEVIKIVGETFPKAIEIKTNIPRDLSTVVADPTQMHQVLLNVLVNARDAMPGGGTLTISAENVELDESYSRMNLEAKPGPYICIVITDTGTGIPADVREKIFEPFFTTKEIGKGTGLGLSTTLAIVKSHGGFINLESELRKGTTFRIYIPATGTTSGEEAAIEEVVLPAGNDELILVIDDEASIREISKETLEAHGYKVMTASDGAEGVAVFAENKKNIDIVITDIMMPVMDGTAAIIALKRINPDVKIIAASGLTTQRQLTTPSSSNVLAFLPKPYTAEKMLKTLAQVRK